MPADILDPLVRAATDVIDEAITVGLASLLLLAAGMLAYALTPLPGTAGAALPAPDTRILDRHGALIADLPQGGIRHDVMPFSAFPFADPRSAVRSIVSG